jgi:hypothetical protein
MTHPKKQSISTTTNVLWTQAMKTNYSKKQTQNQILRNNYQFNSRQARRGEAYLAQILGIITLEEAAPLKTLNHQYENASALASN